MLYRLLRPVLFRMDPEEAHDRVLRLLERVDRSPRVRRFLEGRYVVDDPILETEAFGLTFHNPVGIAAGFDKDARLVHVLPCLGFGFVEVGTVTREAQEGNPRPRVFRYRQARALVNRLGFNNEGVEAVAQRLATEGRPSVPLGVNIGKSASVPLEEAPADYEATLERLWTLADYVAVNVSSPNTPGLRDLQAVDHLDEVLGRLQATNQRLADEAGAPTRPLLVKVSPDLPDKGLQGVVDVARERGVAGLIATNTTTRREDLPEAPSDGGLSGAPLRDRATEVVAELHRLTDGKVPIVGVGGVFTGDDALEKVQAGARLVQTYTGFIYGGPGTARRMNRELADLLREHGYGGLEEAVGDRAQELAP